MEYDINEMRKCIEMSPSKELFDIKGTFYYDETDNVRKYYLKETGVNEQIDRHFVLGGVYLEEGCAAPDVEALKAKLNISKDLEELKSKNLYNGDLLKILDNKHIHIFLEWILDSQFYVHYSVINLYYYALVDIVDSVIKPRFNPLVFEFKNDLYQVAKKNHTDFNDILYKYNYPNISNENIEAFLKAIREYMDKNRMVTTPFISMLLAQMKDEDITSLPFIQDEEDWIFLKDLSQFYYYPIYGFYSSKHIFDHEKEIEENHFKDVTFKIGDLPLKSYEFKDSKDEPMIQISDCIVGLICRFYKFLDEFDGKIHALDTRLNERQKTNLSTLCKIIKKTIDYNEKLIYMVVPMKEARNYSSIVRKYAK